MAFFDSIRAWWIGRSWTTVSQDGAESAAPFVGKKADNGKLVTVNNALELSTFWACVGLISETVSTLPLHLYERDTDGKRKAARDMPLYRLLHDMPNSQMTAVEFWELMVASICLWGNAYAEKKMDGGKLVALNPLRPERMTVYLDGRGQVRFKYQVTSSTVKDYAQEEIFHLMGRTLDGLVGLSPIANARETIGHALGTNAAAATFFKNGIRVGGFLKTGAATLQPDQRAALAKNLARYREPENAGAIMLLEAGMEFQPMTMNPEDAQMLESQKFSVEEICRWYRVFPHMVGHSNVTTWGSAVETNNQAFLDYTLRPYLSKIEQRISKDLLTPAERLKYFAEFSVEGLLRADSAGRASLYSTYTQNGIMSRNEVRALENLPPVGGGDELTVQLNLSPISQLGQKTPADTVKEQLKNWLGDIP